jgi:hypothetical protein
MDSVTVEITDDQSKLNEILAMGDIVEIEIATGLFRDLDPEATLKGIYNELPNPRVPSRPFVEPTYIGNEKWMQRQVIANLKRGNNPNVFMVDMMNQMVDKIKHRINMGRFVKLADSTIAKKGHALPLKDTMEMYNAIKSRRLK